ncbi:hypothetical protein THAOC_10171, partial [Thalassiosira oceanica]
RKSVGDFKSSHLLAEESRGKIGRENEQSGQGRLPDPERQQRRPQLVPARRDNHGGVARALPERGGEEDIQPVDREGQRQVPDACVDEEIVRQDR